MYGLDILCEFQMYPLKFYTKYLTHTLKDVWFIEKLKFKISHIYEPLSVFEPIPMPRFGVWNSQMFLWCCNLTWKPSLWRNITLLLHANWAIFTQGKEFISFHL